MSAIAIPSAATPPANGRKRWRWSRDQYRKLVEQGHFDGTRVELIRGEIVEMSPINWPHQLAKIKVARLLQAAFAGAAWVNEQGPLAAAGSEPQPDAAVIAGRPEDYTDHPQTALLVVEVADTTLNYDLTEKAELYATARVPEYWVLDLNARQLHVLRDPGPLPSNLDAVAYRAHATLGPLDTVSPLAAPNSPLTVSDLLP
jgi:Uma2 family endonuclease